MTTTKPADTLRVRSLENLLSADIPTRRPLLGTWLTDRHLNMTYAAAGVGKSMFAMTIALAIAGGGSAFEWTASDANRVLYVDGEMDVLDLKERAEMLLAAMPDVDQEAAGQNLAVMAYQDQDFGVRFPDIADEGDRQRIITKVREFGAALVILDNFSTLCTVEDENAANSFDPAIDLIRQLKQLGCAVMLIHHSRKAGTTSGGGGYRGTSKMAVIFNSITCLEHPSLIPSQDGTAFKLTWEKFRGLRDETIVPFVAKLGRQTEGAKWECDAVASTQTARLVALVQSCAHPTQAALAAVLKVSEGQLSKLKAKAVSEGLITLAKWDEAMKLAQEIEKEGAADDLRGGLERFEEVTCDGVL